MKSFLIALTAMTISTQALAQNHLLGEASPYLQQHLYNEVDWYPWGEEALEKARVEGKPIFLSIGYSSCHWCHVMEEESFESAEIGAFMNAHFVSIKVDRERRPDLDEQFMLVTQIVSGSGGWPNSVFLTSEAKPFFGGTYYPPEVFMGILRQVNDLWRDQRVAVEAEAEALSGSVRQYLNRSAAARDLTPRLANAVAMRMLDQIDPFNGGMGVAPKFPQESAYLYLLDQAERTGDREFLQAVTDTLDGMIMGGIHDHVGGGFHRYSVDPEWHVPHFEKMLYNQAMIGRILVRVARITGSVIYERAAIRTFDAVLRDMQAADGGFYSALDADSLNEAGEKEEGVYYAWTPEQVRQADAEFLIDVLNITEDGNFEGSNSVHLTEINNSNDFLAHFDAALEQLRLARLQRSAPFIDEKIIVSWNAMMIATLAEASNSFERPDYYDAAARAARFILDEMLDGEDLMRISLDGAAAVDAQSPDYAALGLALIALHDFAPDGGAEWLGHAETMANAIMERFIEESGVYRMSATPDGLGTVLPLDDGEIPGGNGMVLALFSGLANRVENPVYAQQARLLAAAVSGHALSLPEQRAYTLEAIQNFNSGERGAVRFVASGAVRVETVIDRQAGMFRLSITVKDGWHINAHQPLEDYFIPTSLTIGDQPTEASNYPDPLITTLSFNDQPLALYEGELTLSAVLPEYEQGAAPLTAVLTLQACSDEICLAPVDLRFTLW